MSKKGNGNVVNGDGAVRHVGQAGAAGDAREETEQAPEDAKEPRPLEAVRRKGPYPKFHGDTYRASFVRDRELGSKRFADLCIETAQIELALEQARILARNVAVVSGWALVPEEGLGLLVSILCELTGKGPWE